MPISQYFSNNSSVVVVDQVANCTGSACELYDNNDGFYLKDFQLSLYSSGNAGVVPVPELSCNDEVTTNSVLYLIPPYEHAFAGGYEPLLTYSGRFDSLHCKGTLELLFPSSDVVDQFSFYANIQEFTVNQLPPVSVALNTRDSGNLVFMNGLQIFFMLLIALGLVFNSFIRRPRRYAS